MNVDYVCLTFRFSDRLLLFFAFYFENNKEFVVVNSILLIYKGGIWPVVLTVPSDPLLLYPYRSGT